MTNLLLVPEILPGMLKWTCKIMVIEKQNARNSKSTPPKMYRPMVLQDAAGNKVQAMTYGDEIDLFGQKMELYGTYLLSGAVVKAARDTARSPDPKYPNVWTLTRSTYLQNVPASEAFGHELAPKFHLTPITAIYDFIGGDKLFNFIAVVIYKFPRQWISSKDKNIPAAEFLIVDESCIPVILTLWETFSAVQGLQLESELRKGALPTIFVKNVGCTLFQGIKIGTKYSSSFEISPASERALSLDQWKASNVHAIQTMIREKAHLSSLLKIAKPLAQPYLKAVDLTHVYAQDKLFWIEGNISLPAHDAVQPYVGCNLCTNKINADEGKQLNCNYCGQKNGITKKIHKLSVSISDDTGSVLCLLFPDEVEHLLSVANVALADNNLDDKLLAEKLAPIKFVVGLKKSNKDDGTRFYHSFVVACLEEVGKLKSPALLGGQQQHPQLKLSKEIKSTGKDLAASTVSPTKTSALPITASSSLPTDRPSGAKKKLDFVVCTPDKAVGLTPANLDADDDAHASSDYDEVALKGNKRLKLA